MKASNRQGCLCVCMVLINHQEPSCHESTCFERASDSALESVTGRIIVENEALTRTAPFATHCSHPSPPTHPVPSRPILMFPRVLWWVDGLPCGTGRVWDGSIAVYTTLYIMIRCEFYAAGHHVSRYYAERHCTYIMGWYGFDMVCMVWYDMIWYGKLARR